MTWGRNLTLNFENEIILITAKERSHADMITDHSHSAVSVKKSSFTHDQINRNSSAGIFFIRKCNTFRSQKTRGRNRNLTV